MISNKSVIDGFLKSSAKKTADYPDHPDDVIHFITYDQGVIRIFCTKKEIRPPYKPEKVTIYPEYATCPDCFTKNPMVIPHEKGTKYDF